MPACPECGAEFAGRSTRRVYCGNRCMNAAKGRRAKAERATAYRPPKVTRTPEEDAVVAARVVEYAARVAQGLTLFEGE